MPRFISVKISMHKRMKEHCLGWTRGLALTDHHLPNPRKHSQLTAPEPVDEFGPY